jgi:hypothetical protein
MESLCCCTLTLLITLVWICVARVGPGLVDGMAGLYLYVMMTPVSYGAAMVYLSVTSRKFCSETVFFISLLSLLMLLTSVVSLVTLKTLSAVAAGSPVL